MTNVFNFLPDIDAGAFLEIQRHFLGHTLDMDSIREPLIMIGAAAVVLLCIMLILHFRPKKTYVPDDWVLGPREINALLSEALDQRAKIELHFAREGEARRPALRCAFVALESGTLLLEASKGASLSPKWQGRSVDCFFILRKENTYAFYSFASELAEIKTVNDICSIRVKVPEKIESRQKRSYLRIAPPEEYTLGAALWRGLDMPEDRDRNDLALWPKPARIWLPGVREEFTIRDISSGGLRLHLPRHILPEEMDFIHVSTQFIIMLDLWEPDKAQRLRFWLLCRMQSPVLDFETKGMDIGAQFLAWAKPAETGSSNLLWLKLASSGEVEPLGNWIMRRHLEFFRESEDSLTFAQRQTP